jgi:hypothetical protein
MRNPFYSPARPFSVFVHIVTTRSGKVVRELRFGQPSGSVVFCAKCARRRTLKVCP